MKKYFDEALNLDRNDKLAHFKERFITHADLIYLDGNSLGKLPIETIKITSDLIQKQWGDRLIRSWNENWLDLSTNISSKLAKIIGARPDEIFVGDTTSLNLYKLIYASLASQKGKYKIISDTLNFPTDLYVIEGIVQQHFTNHYLELVESTDGISINPDSIKKIMDPDTALITLSLVTYKSSFLYNMLDINTLAHKNNSLVIWDLSHAAGAVPIDLNKTNADMAVGCTYKYLNGGPGSPAFLYVKKELQEKLNNPVWSWFGHQKPFDFDLKYKKNKGIQKFAIGTPSILSMAPVETGLEIIIEAGMDNLRTKSLLLSGFLLTLIREILVPMGFKIASPLNDNERGSHISIQHREGYRISRAMIQPLDHSKIIIPDFRPPNNLRLGISPLYNTFMDMYETVARIKSIMQNKDFENYSKETLTVV